jgi:hypothetical protein
MVKGETLLRSLAEVAVAATSLRRLGRLLLI